MEPVTVSQGNGEKPAWLDGAGWQGAGSSPGEVLGPAAVPGHVAPWKLFSHIPGGIFRNLPTQVYAGSCVSTLCIFQVFLAAGGLASELTASTFPCDAPILGAVTAASGSILI